MTDQAVPSSADRGKVVLDVCGVCLAIGTFITPLGYVAGGVLIAALAAIVLPWLGGARWPWLARRKTEIVVFAALIAAGAGLALYARATAAEPEPKSAIEALAVISNQVRQVNTSLGSIDRKLDNVKKETSDDPRKELFNMGIAWNYANFRTAIRDGDTRAVGLFMAGGQRIESFDDVFLAMTDRAFSPKMVDALASGGPLEPTRCLPTREDRGYPIGVDDVLAKPERIAAFRRICGGDAFVVALEAYVSARKASLVSDLAAAPRPKCTLGATGLECPDDGGDPRFPSAFTVNRASSIVNTERLVSAMK